MIRPKFFYQIIIFQISAPFPFEYFLFSGGDPPKPPLLFEFFIFRGTHQIVFQWRRNMVQWTINLFHIWYNDQYFVSCYKNETFIGCNGCKLFESICECFQQQSDESKNSIPRALAITIKKMIKMSFCFKNTSTDVCSLEDRTDVGRKIPTGQKFSSSVEKDSALRAETLEWVFFYLFGDAHRFFGHIWEFGKIRKYA